MSNVPHPYSEIPPHLRQYFLAPGEEEPIRRIDVEFYMDATLQEAVEYLSKRASPLDYGWHTHNSHFLFPKAEVLDDSFLLCEPDLEILQEKEHRMISEMLGFQPKSELRYGRCSVTDKR